ncbi:methylase of polypeptide chain release factors [Geofilum rubicundum JCM 15548]|uniref:peptide chain release factor N(5)-glutamine methyltransferase n=2 Tax=Geofilum TaxID=1236988 RepID=A0A0E9LVU8_9BACT|nr:methylase of polypeptide chain release factors [Geofilum rubicundum JCM 15548]
MMKGEEKLSNEEVAFIHEAVVRLQGHEPLQYVLGQTHFMDMVFKVNPHVLIPRPETEELVTWILEEAPLDRSSGGSKAPLEILDIGTGSGCIPIALKKNRPWARVEAWDISAEALETARGNALLNHVEVDFQLRDVLNYQKYPLAPRHVVISNPPYVTQSEQTKMAQNVLEHEPHLALFVADDTPLLFYRVIAQMATTCLLPDGCLYFEINEPTARRFVPCSKNLDLNK